MIFPTPGANDASRLFGWATPPDGAGPIGPDGAWPVAVPGTFDGVLRGLNPLQHIPVVGMLYRAATGQEIPTTMRVLGAGLVGGPLGMLGAGVMGLVVEIIRMGPDTSRPPAPAGMSQTGTERPMDTVSPGEVPAGGYTTLATVVPEFLQPSQLVFGGGRGQAAYASAAREWQVTQALEKGMA